MVDKIPENQRNAINQTKADGISAEERKKLEMQGVADELLEKLSGTKSADEVDEAIEAYLNEQQESPSFWKNPLKWFKSDKVSTGEKILAGVGIGVVAGLTGWGAVAVLGAKGATVALAATAVCGTMASCTPDDAIVEGNTTNLFNNIKIDVTQAQDPALIDAMLKMQETINNMSLEQQQSNKHLQTIITLLTTLSTKVSSIEEKGAEHTKLLTLIYEQLNSLTTNTTENSGKILAYLQKISDQLENMDAKQVEAHRAILTKLNNINANINNLNDSNRSLFNKVLEKLEKIGFEDAGYLEILNKILDEITKSAEQNKAMSQETQALLQTIIENQDKLKGSLETGISAILAKLDKMDDSMKKGFTNIINHIVKGNNIDAQILAKLTQVLEKLDNMSKTDKAAYTAILNAIQNIDVGDNSELSAQLSAILDAINNGNSVTAAQLEELRKLIAENNEIARGTREAVDKLGENMDANQKAILEKLKAGNASLDEIKELLQGIQTGVTNNTVQLTEINDKLSLAGAVINNILTRVNGLKDETKALLLQILAKIPNGCTCTTVDLSVLLDKLDKILDALKKDCADGKEDENHEGILENLEDYFG